MCRLDLDLLVFQLSLGLVPLFRAPPSSWLLSQWQVEGGAGGLLSNPSYLLSSLAQGMKGVIYNPVLVGGRCFSYLSSLPSLHSACLPQLPFFFWVIRTP